MLEDIHRALDRYGADEENISPDVTLMRQLMAIFSVYCQGEGVGNPLEKPMREMEKRMQELEVENNNLKAEVVHLRRML